MTSGPGTGETDPLGERSGPSGERSGPLCRCVIANDVDALSRALESLDAFLEGEGDSGETAFTVRLLAEEIVTNVIKYAYDDAGAHEITIELRLTPASALLIVTDDGKEFDPLAAPRPDLDVPLEEKKIGGVGIHLVRTLAERLEYTRAGGKNVIAATIRREPKA
jgi:anti-sigma regulatory factor (Ser/Thr protein kinase)